MNNFLKIPSVQHWMDMGSVLARLWTQNGTERVPSASIKLFCNDVVRAPGLNKELNFEKWQDSSVAKNTHCSFRGLELGSWQLIWTTHNCLWLQLRGFHALLCFCRQLPSRSHTPAYSHRYVKTQEVQNINIYYFCFYYYYHLKNLGS